MNRIGLFIVSFFFGAIGVDRFISGKILTGFLKLLTGGGLGIWWIVDMVRILLTGRV